MKKSSVIFIIIAASLIVCGKIALADPVKAVIAGFASAWDRVKTYECSISSHEVNGTKVQDRVYTVWFSKPLNTRVEIVGGDGRGSAAVWDGGKRVRGHQGGILAFVKLNVNINSRIATTIRGTTIAQVNFGSLLNHIESLNRNALSVTKEGANTLLTAQTDYPPPDSDVTREVYVFGSGGLPVEYFQFAKNDVVKHVVYSHLRLNIDLPPSTWRI